MSSSVFSLLGTYRYDALDRLANMASAGQEPVSRFYRESRLTTSIQGASHHSVVQTEDLLLALRRVESGQVLFDLLATDQSNSVLHSLEVTQRTAFAYSPYGVPSPQTASHGAPGFTGQMPDPITGHYWLGNGARVFNPTLMRFNSPDTLSPFGAGGLNSYAYCIGDPVNYSDPTGHFPVVTPEILRILRMVPMAVTHAKNLRVPGALRVNVDEVIETSRQAMTRDTSFSAEMTGARKYLGDGLNNLDKRHTFINKLDSVNKNLASHGKDVLSKSHAQYYLDVARKVHAGEVSNTGAHMAAAAKWAAQIPNPRTRSDGLVGTLFNAAGALGEGVNDHRLLKTGLALTNSPRRMAQDIRSTTGTP